MTPTAAETGRLLGKSGIGLALVVLGLIGPSIIAPLIPGGGDDALLAILGPYAINVGVPLAGWGLLDKARKLALMVEAAAGKVGRGIPQR